MPIDKKNKLLFVHIPKCGGTSINNIFNFKKKFKYLSGIDKENRIQYNHLTLKQIKKFIKLKKYFSFSFVRNPFDKMVSEFFFRKSFENKNCILYLGQLDLQKLTFEEFINKIFEVKLTHSLNRTFGEAHLVSQTKYLYVKGKLKIDFLGRFENYEKDLKKLLKKLKRKKGIELQEICHKNSSSHENYKNYYNSSTKKIIEKMYEDDLNNFNYVF